jgi:hypothetical protein
VRLQKGYLAWSHAERIRAGEHWLWDGQVAREAIVTRQRAEHDGRGILDEFILLTDAPDKAILQYARTWGVLELCRHALPACHEFQLSKYLLLPPPVTMKPSPRVEPPSDPRQCPPLGREPLTTWRFFARQARALLTIAADLQYGRLGALEDWSMLLRKGVKPAQSLDAHRACLRNAIGDWLRIGRLKPAMDDLSGALTWTGADLFGELTVQIALAAQAADGRVFCVACGKPYQPKRRVIRCGFNYCPAKKCQRLASAQRSQQYRDRKKSTKGEDVSDRKLPFRAPYGGRTDDPQFSQ